MVVGLWVTEKVPKLLNDLTQREELNYITVSKRVNDHPVLVSGMA
jgi:hypothetical protein